MMAKGMACLDVVAYKRNENENQDQKQINKEKVGEKRGSKLVDAYKSTTKDHVLVHTSIRAWKVSGWNSLVAQNGFLVLDVQTEDMFIQL